MKTFVRRHGNVLLKAIIILLLGYGLYRQILARKQVDALWAAFLEEFRSPRLPLLYAVVFLMPINWSVEALKWQILLKQLTYVPFWQLYKGVMGGITVAMFTPNRLGEHGGRILFVASKHNWSAFVSGIVGSFSQMLVLISFGIIGLLYFATQYLGWGWQLMQSFLVVGSLLISLMFYFYFNVNVFLSLAKKIPGSQRLKPYAKHLYLLGTFSKKSLALAILLSATRYSIYTLQYFLMLRFFGLDFPFLPAIAGIASIFLFQTSVPLPPVIGLLARGELALFIWNNFGSNEISILGASFTLFIINLSVPALLGLVYIVKINILKSLGYEH